MSIRVKAIVTDHDLSLIGDMSGDPGNEVEVVHLGLLGIGVSVLVYDFPPVLIER